MAKKETKKAEPIKVVTLKKVKCTTPFYDIAVQANRCRGDEWEVDAERLSKIKAAEKHYGVQIVEVL